MGCGGSKADEPMQQQAVAQKYAAPPSEPVKPAQLPPPVAPVPNPPSAGAQLDNVSAGNTLDKVGCTP